MLGLEAWNGWDGWDGCDGCDVCFGWIDFHLTMMESSWLKLEWNHAGLGGKQHGKLGQ